MALYEQFFFYGTIIAIVLFVVLVALTFILKIFTLTGKPRIAEKDQPADTFPQTQNTIIIPPKTIAESAKPDGSGAIPTTAASVIPPLPLVSSPAEARKQPEHSGVEQIERSKAKFEVNEIVKPDKKPVSTESINMDFPYNSLEPQSAKSKVAEITPNPITAPAAQNPQLGQSPVPGPAAQPPLVPPVANIQPQVEASVQVPQQKVVTSKKVELPPLPSTTETLQKPDFSNVVLSQPAQINTSKQALSRSRDLLAPQEQGIFPNSSNISQNKLQSIQPVFGITSPQRVDAPAKETVSMAVTPPQTTELNQSKVEMPVVPAPQVQSPIPPAPPQTQVQNTPPVSNLPVGDKKFNPLDSILP